MKKHASKLKLWPHKLALWPKTSRTGGGVPDSGGGGDGGGFENLASIPGSP